MKPSRNGRLLDALAGDLERLVSAVAEVVAATESKPRLAAQALRQSKALRRAAGLFTREALHRRERLTRLWRRRPR